MRNEPNISLSEAPVKAIDLERVESVALRRLIEEVRQDDGVRPLDTTLYNRTYHRHNR